MMKRSSSPPGKAPRQRTSEPSVASKGTFARVSVTRKLLSESLERRLAILDAPDMLTTGQGADLVGMTRAGIVDRIKRGAALGLVGPKRGYKLPRWQFEPLVWQALPRVSEALGSTEGWEMFSFLETPHGALAGATPRRALEQGRVEEVLGLAAAHSLA
jgi:hypothetical protein